MRIKRLDITGFKSFMERAVIAFDDGVTGVVGPNGCGKSNVVDAIRWVMGEQSAKNLRGRGMEDVIFNGSESKPPLSMAEVSLTLKVEDSDLLSPQYAGLPEVSITRRLFRSGESEYLINKTPCRLLDVTELFLGTGVGTKAYSIIEQGRVGLIVSAKPEDRRTFIEEAAGVTKYKARRKAAERKMEYTQQNLLRVNDIVAELEKRLESLQRQAKKAEKYRKLRAEVREIELHQAAHRYLELFAEKKALDERLHSLSEREQAGAEAVQALELAIVARRDALTAQSAELEALAGQVHALEAQHQLDEQNLSHWTADAESSRRRVEQARIELAELEARAGALRAQLAAGEAEQAAQTAAWKDDEVSAQVVAEELRRANELITEFAVRLDEERKQLGEVDRRITNHEAQLASLAHRRADLETRRGRFHQEVEKLHEEERTLEQVREQVQGKLAETRRLAQELSEQRGREEISLSQTREAFAENEIQVIYLREELADKRSRLNSLQEIQRNYEGFDRGVRSVMRLAGEDPRAAGVFGLVADVFSTEPRFERAVEAALGERLQHVIVERSDQGFTFAEHLKNVAEGRSSFIPIQDFRPREPTGAPPDLTQPGVLATARSQVRTEATLEPLADALLGGVVIVEDLEAARRYARSGGEAFTLVTLDGEVLLPDGTVTGGVMEGPAVGALQKKREIAELTAEVESLEARYNETITRHYALQKQMGQTEGLLKGLSKNHHAEELNLANQEKDLHKAGEDLAKLRGRIGTLSREEEQLVQGLEAVGREEETARSEVAFGQADRATREERVRQMTLELEALKARASSLSDELTALRVKVASSAEKGEAARRALEGWARQVAEVEERQARLTQAAEQDTARLTELEARMAETGNEREQRTAQLEQLRGQLDEVRGQWSSGTQEVRAEEELLRERRLHLEEVMGEGGELSLRGRELGLELDYLRGQTVERHQVELETELHRFHLLAPLPPQTEAQLKELRGQIERLGEINLTAIEEHAELEQRYVFLSGQKSDLEASLDQLRSAISKIDKTSRERFQQTFDVVNEKFQQVFPRLFGGGRASLVLTQEGPGGEAGVEIVAQPPGKKLQSVNLFSGGEKALTAVSLIFAIFLIKPTPFCILDEVDAPLDEANVGRYNEMVKEMSKQSQFILITHNKRTMEIVDTLYGVTMEEPGISKLVSVRMKEAVAANDNQAA